ncbi:hypothetical protein F4777DRAFT_598860 [Nemania sp. FL0916]|nr:hypothetical protein F4777DRAFT_598860 [Nemania sp. FL0916]
MAPSARESAASLSKRPIEDMEQDYELIRVRAEMARREIKLTHNFNMEYWTSAAKFSSMSVRMQEAGIKLSISKWKDEAGEDDSEEWWTTPEAHRVIEKLKAAQFEKITYEQQAVNVGKTGHVKRAFKSLSTISSINLAVPKARMGRRSRSQLAKFKDELIEFYGAATYHPKKPNVIQSVHDSATGKECFKRHIATAHFVPHYFGNDMLVALFGEGFKEELNSPYNGLILENVVEKAMDYGTIVAVPNLPDNPTNEKIETWEKVEPKNYKWKIIDPDSDLLDEVVDFRLGDTTYTEITTVRDLEGRQLSFKNDMRPRARYLYYVFVVAQLRLAWRHEYRNDPSRVQLGMWPTRGRYLAKSFLLALANEIGHDTDFVENVSVAPAPGDHEEEEPDDTGLIGIAQYLQFGRHHAEDEVLSDDENDTEDDE